MEEKSNYIIERDDEEGFRRRLNTATIRLIQELEAEVLRSRMDTVRPPKRRKQNKM